MQLRAVTVIESAQERCFVDLLHVFCLLSLGGCSWASPNTWSSHGLSGSWPACSAYLSQERTFSALDNLLLGRPMKFTD